MSDSTIATEELSFNQSFVGVKVLCGHHVDAGGRLAEDHEVCHSQRSCYRYKVLQDIPFPDLQQIKRIKMEVKGAGQ